MGIVWGEAGIAATVLRAGLVVGDSRFTRWAKERATTILAQKNTRPDFLMEPSEGSGWG